MEMNKDVKPNKSFRGKVLPKSLSWYRDVKMARNKTKAMIEKQRATSDETAKRSNPGLFSSGGMPLLSKPPGTLVEAVKATVAMSAATTEHD